MAKHKCPNEFRGEGANGGCYFEISENEDGHPTVDVGWSCIVVHDKPMPITWLAEVIAIATAHSDGVAGFLAENNYGGPSYALACDPNEGQSDD